MKRYGLRNDQWEKIADMLPGRKGSRGRTAKDNRLFVEAIIYRYKTGVPWRNLPERFGDFRVIHTRFSRWSKAGIWESVFKVLGMDADKECAMIDDSAVVRDHQLNEP